jgi:hypothetical protein
VTAARHPTTATWDVPGEREPLPAPCERINLRALIARPSRFEHHLIACATIGRVQLEVVTASEPLYFAHVNLSDEYAVALPTGDAMIDGFPFRTFLSDPTTGADVGRYNHGVGDLVLHPVELAHWPGRLRPPYQPFPIPPGMRRCGLSLVYCANQPTPATPVAVPVPAGRDGDAKAYVAPAPRMVLAAVLDGAPGVLARIDDTELALVERPAAIAPARGAWVVVLVADAGCAHAACDLVRVPAGATLDTAGVTRALVLASAASEPDPVPAVWRALAPPPIAPYEDAAAGALPIDLDGLRVEAVSAEVVRVSIGAHASEVPRYWLARMLFRIALHDMRLGTIETYGGLFVDDRDGVTIGLRTAAGRAGATIPRDRALAAIELLYRAVAPPGYRERLDA